MPRLDKRKKRGYRKGMNMTNQNTKETWKRYNSVSVEAYRSIKPMASTLREQVLAFIENRGNGGATDDEVEAVTGMRHQTASARRRELVLKGLVRDSGLRRETRSGRNATVWVVT